MERLSALESTEALRNGLGYRSISVRFCDPAPPVIVLFSPFHKRGSGNTGVIIVNEKVAKKLSPDEFLLFVTCECVRTEQTSRWLKVAIVIGIMEACGTFKLDGLVALALVPWLAGNFIASALLVAIAFWIASTEPLSLDRVSRVVKGGEIQKELNALKLRLHDCKPLVGWLSSYERQGFK